ncbi:carbohydrate-responsive element-binding protein-like isoform X2 [Lineus longissimus]|uniref:carbohydrate-responsive element-binding protein-like isoform X2 n=1 Tax=Lineus longissimus TaxID=88925 RepID=UPI002B4D82EB
MLKLAMYRNSDLAKSDTCLADDDIGPDQNTTKGKDISVLDHSDEKTIHSGHFMVSQVHQEPESDEDEDKTAASKSPEHEAFSPPRIAYDFVSASHTPQESYQFGTADEQSQGRLSMIDGSLTRLFECMTLAYSKITSPRWKTFKGMKLNVKDKIRLNNIIWREWHMQYIKSKFPLVCQFAAPLSEDSHSRPEAIVMEGKYWKRRLQTVTAEYQKWRGYFKNQMNRARMDEKNDQDLSHEALLDRLATQDRIRIHPQRSPTPGLSNIDEDLLMDFSDTLFSSFKEPLLFPNPREIGQLGNADFIQPGLVQLQPNFEDLMDTIENFSEMWGTTSGTLAQARSEPSLAVMETGQSSNGLFQAQNNNSFLQSLLVGSTNRVPDVTRNQQQVGTNDLNLAQQTQQPVLSNEPSAQNMLQNTLMPQQSAMPQSPQPMICSDLDQANLLASNLNQAQSLLANQANQSLLNASLQQTLLGSSGQGQGLSFPTSNVTQQQLLQQLQAQQPLILQSGTAISVGNLQSQLTSLLTSQPQTLNLVTLSDHSQVKLEPVDQLTLAQQILNPGLTGETAVREPSSSLGTTIVSQSVPKTMTTTTPSTSVLASHLVASPPSQGLPSQPKKSSSKKGEFAVPKNKPLQRKPRNIAPAVTNSPAMQQNTFLAQLLTAGPSTGATFNLNIKQEAPSSCISVTSVQNTKSLLSQVPIAIAPQPQVTDFAKNLVIATTPQAISSALLQQDSFRSITAAPTTTTGSPLISSTTDMRLSSPINLNDESMQDLDSSFEEASKAFRPKNPVEREVYKEHRRVSHISSEQKRRCNIKNGFDTLQVLIPSLSANPNQKLSKATMLQKTADYCKKLKSERSHMQNEADLLKQEIESLNSQINACQSQLPATGAPVTRQRVDHMKEMCDDYIRNRTMQNWKFWIFITIFRDLFASFNNMVSTATVEELCRTCLAWLDQHCSLVALRPAVLNSLRRLSTTTSILSDPSKVPEQAHAAVSRRDSDPMS